MDLEKKYKIYKFIAILGTVVFVIINILFYFNFMHVNTNNSCQHNGIFSHMSVQEKNIYNSKIQPYVKEKTKGSEVKSLIDDIISLNQSNVGEEGKFIGIKIEEETISSYTTKEQEKLKKACEKASIFSSKDGSTIEDGENNGDNVRNATEEMKILKKAINIKKNYDVTAMMSEGIYTWIIISEVK